MNLNEDFEMAVKTILFLKENKSSEYVRTHVIAKHLNYSLSYFQTLIQVLSRHGILDCKRGRIGGVRLRAKVVSLLDLWKIIVGEPYLFDPPMAVMKKPLKTFADAMKKVILYKGK